MVTIEFKSTTDNNYHNHTSLVEIIDELVSMNDDIFHITKFVPPTYNEGCSITLNIYFNNFSGINIHNEEYSSKLEKIIELLKDIKKIKKRMSSLPNQYNLKIILYEPNDQFSEEYNKFIVDFNSKL